MPVPRPGDPAPLWVAATDHNPRFVFSSLGGRWVLLGLVGSAGAAPLAQALEPLRAGGWPFDVDHCAGFLVSLDPADREKGRIPQAIPGLRAVWDFDGAVSRAHEAWDGTQYRPVWLLLDPMLRIHSMMPLTETRAMLDLIGRLPPPGEHSGMEVPAPVLVLPRLFEPELCRELIARYRAQGGEVSGFMVERNGRTVSAQDPTHKVRRDVTIEDEQLRGVIQNRILTRLVPEIQKAFQFRVTRMERYLVACYAAEEGGHFAAHRDNTTKGTAHRRFAVTINLNAEEFEGGDLSFPEFGPRRYRAPTGGCVVFSCSLLHQAHRVTKGERYAFLPFLYDDAAAQIREENRRFVGAEPVPETAG